MPADRTLELRFDPPLAHAGGEVRQATVREPTGAEMRECERRLVDPNADTFTGFQVALLSKVTGLGEPVIADFPVSVMARAFEFLDGFDDRGGLPVGGEDTMSSDIDLIAPIESNGVTYVTLELAEPTVGMRRKAETALRGGQSPANLRQYQMILVAEAAGVPFAAVEMMPISTINQAQAFLHGFFRPGPASGKS